MTCRFNFRLQLEYYCLWLFSLSMKNSVVGKSGQKIFILDDFLYKSTFSVFDGRITTSVANKVRELKNVGRYSTIMKLCIGL